LNLGKSKLIQLDPNPELDWFRRSGCTIAEDREVLKSLGIPFGKKVTAKQEINFVLGKVRKRLRTWSFRLLPMASRILALQHVLRAIPAYFLMTLSFTKDGFNQLETVCRQFLWGSQPSGNPKMPLVAWNKITTSKLEGGLGITSFKVQARNLKLKFISKLTDQGPQEWGHMLSTIIQNSLKHGILRKETKFWTVQEYLILFPPVHIFSRIGRCLMSSWKRVQPKLWLNREKSSIPKHSSILQLYLLSLQGSTFDNVEYREMRVWAHTRRIKSAADLFNVTWLTLSEISQRTRAHHNTGKESFQKMLNFVAEGEGVSSQMLEKVKGWQWDTGGRPLQGWHHSMGQWRKVATEQTQLI
jgi:hypothetical protein